MSEGDILKETINVHVNGGNRVAFSYTFPKGGEDWYWYPIDVSADSHPYWDVNYPLLSMDMLYDSNGVPTGLDGWIYIVNVTNGSWSGLDNTFIRITMIKVHKKEE